MVAVRVHADEPNEHREPYNLGIIGQDLESDKLCWKNGKSQLVGTNVVNKNVQLVRF